MPMVRVEIKNFKSLKDIKIDLNSLNCFLGENGTGKSNILKCVNYFYDNLVRNNINTNLLDRKNPYHNYMEISIFYDLSRLINIAEISYSNNGGDEAEVHPYFKKIYSMREYANYNKILKVTLRQYKNNELEWNLPYDVRVFLKNVFPVYFIEARHINLTDWDILWEVIGDLSKSKIGNMDNEMEGVLNSLFGEQQVKIIEYIRKEFAKAEIELRELTPKQLFSQLYQMQLGGKEFRFKDEKLDFYSDGMNSFNLIKLLIKFTTKISADKLKESCLLIDEPEIGLHPRFIDNLAETLKINNNNTRIAVATHSSRLIRGIMINQSEECNLFHISTNRNYTTLRMMNGFADGKARNVMSEKEASFYFSKAILFVEGPTEIELFTNNRIIELFPELKNAEVYSFDSDNTKLNLTIPSKKNTSIPFILLLDLDKVIAFNGNTNKFKPVRGSINPLTSSVLNGNERYFYGKKRLQTYTIRNYILEIMKKRSFSYDPNWGIVNDPDFISLKYYLKLYHMQYRIFLQDTTVEGSLINLNNHSIVYNWLRTMKETQIIDDIYNFQTSDLYKVSALRLIHNGKLDNLLEPPVLGRVPILEREIFKKINKVKNKKTSGWISDFIEYYFTNYIDPLPSRKMKREQFILHFRELSDILMKIEDMLQIKS